MADSIVPVSSIEVSELGGELVVDSRLIAKQLGIQHETLMKTIKKYESKIEQRFGCIRFEIGVPEFPTGNPPKYALLTENQATTLMTFSKNTDEVVDCKLDLVAAFDRAKKIIETVIPRQNDRIEELKLELQLRNAESELISKRETILKMLPPAVADRILGVPVVEKIEVRTKVVDEAGFILNAGETVSKTDLAHRYGFLSHTGKADTKLVTRLIDEAIEAGAIESPWRDVRVVASAGFDASLLAKLDRFVEATPRERQRWIGE